MSSSSPKISKMVECIMCSRPLRVKLLGNHLMNQHKVGPDQHTSSLLDESPSEEKGLLTATLSESVFLPIQDLTTMNEDKTLNVSVTKKTNVSLTKKTNVSKLKASKATKMKTSTPRQKKNRVARINKKNNQE